MPTKYVEIPGSHRDLPEEAQAIAPAAHPKGSAESIEISIYLKPREADALLQQPPITAQEAAATGQGHALPRDVGAERATSYADDLAKISAFANKNGLSIVKEEPARRLVKLSGPIDKIEAAFRTKLHYYNDGKHAFRARSGSLSAPADVVDSIEAVLGLDTRPIAKPRMQHHFDPHATAGHLPNEVAKLYDFPRTPKYGGGQCIALIELGGGFRDSDNQKAFKAMHLKTPKVTAISVSRGSNQPGKDPLETEIAVTLGVFRCIALNAF